MKKLFTTYSYTILFLLISCFSALLFSLETDDNKDDFITITVSTGDTIWEIANQYLDDSDLSHKQFINWVVAENNLSENLLYPGEELIIPVKSNDFESKTELASAIGE